ncbi:alpha/beta hydrolase [Aquiflexum sp.]|uniref:alpha/beta hydrolase n=1 Tax=Aquiflexum sp. TaxID=1872584 RepID=UPI00359340BC
MKYNFKYQHTAQYRTSHVINRNEKEIIIALHGYGQLSEFFLKKLEPIFSEDKLIVVPEATNYAYLEGFSGRVGANWMTLHERESAITNNNDYLNGLLENILLKYRIRPIVKVMGFSQGAATATRWVSQLPFSVNSLILWSGGFAHDLNFQKTGEKLKNTEVMIVLGDSDSLITTDSIQKQDEFLSMLPFEVKKLRFEGGHDLNTPFLQKIFG